MVRVMISTIKYRNVNSALEKGENSYGFKKYAENSSYRHFIYCLVFLYVLK